MADEFPEDLRRKLTRYGQEHILRRWSELDPRRAQSAVGQLQALDLGAACRARRDAAAEAGAPPDDALVDRARRAVPPSSIVRLPQTAEERNRWEQARQAGEELLRAGKVGAILVAGGQGTRLGFDKPKGMFPIGSGQPRAAVSDPRRTGAGPFAPRRAADPVFHHDQRRDPRRDGRFFRRARSLRPAAARTSISSRRETCPPSMRRAASCSFRAIKRLCTSPDGHGGMLAALWRRRAARRNEAPRHRIPALPPGRQPDGHRLRSRFPRLSCASSAAKCR